VSMPPLANTARYDSLRAGGADLAAEDVAGDTTEEAGHDAA